MKTVEINKKLYLVPENWNELTTRQLFAVVKVLFSENGFYEGQLKLLKIITGMGWFRFFKIPIEEKQEFIYLTDFLVNENNLTKQLVKWYDGFYGPDDDFNNITGEEFVFSEDYYFKSFSIIEEGMPRQMHEEHLNKLVAVLYRPKKRGYDVDVNKDGDPRIPFNQFLSDYHCAEFIAGWPMHVKMAIFIWYEACRKNMIEGNPDIFGGGSGEHAKYGLLSVMRVIAEGGIHGDFEKVQRMFVKMWMIELNEKHEENERAKKEMKS